MHSRVCEIEVAVVWIFVLAGHFNDGLCMVSGIPAARVTEWEKGRLVVSSKTTSEQFILIIQSLKQVISIQHCDVI